MNQGDLYNALTNGTIKVNTWFELLRRLCAGTLPRGECGWWSRPPPLQLLSFIILQNLMRKKLMLPPGPFVVVFLFFLETKLI